MKIIPNYDIKFPRTTEESALQYTDLLNTTTDCDYWLLCLFSFIRWLIFIRLEGVTLTNDISIPPVPPAAVVLVVTGKYPAVDVWRVESSLSSLDCLDAITASILSLRHTNNTTTGTQRNLQGGGHNFEVPLILMQM